ncbi:MAG: hypothetical protein P4L40_24610 [Terracidiphilus sp.]|nr:hypothetical protein [Terracidiphilus sp.]
MRTPRAAESVNWAFLGKALLAYTIAAIALYAYVHVPEVSGGGGGAAVKNV